MVQAEHSHGGYGRAAIQSQSPSVPLPRCVRRPASRTPGPAHLYMYIDHTFTELHACCGGDVGEGVHGPVARMYGCLSYR